MNVGIITTGYEVLYGKVVNKNQSWISDKLIKIGLKPKIAITVGDNCADISEALKFILSKQIDIVITTGGLGPTFDDITVECIASTLGLKLEVNNEALKMVKERYEALGLKLTPERVKMAELPEGAEPIPNHIGTAPGVHIVNNSVEIYALPGVPSEMKVMMLNYVLPLLRERSTGQLYSEIIKIRGLRESTIAPVIKKIADSNQNVRIKSYPKTTDNQPLVTIELSAIGSTKSMNDVKRVKNKLLETLKKRFKGKYEILPS